MSTELLDMVIILSHFSENSYLLPFVTFFFIKNTKKVIIFIKIQDIFQKGLKFEVFCVSMVAMHCAVLV